MKVRRDAKGKVIAVGDLVRVAKTLSAPAVAEYRRSFKRCAGKVFPVVGWDQTGLAWIPLGRSGVLSVEPRLLSVVRKASVPLGSNKAFQARRPRAARSGAA